MEHRPTSPVIQSTIIQPKECYAPATMTAIPTRYSMIGTQVESGTGGISDEELGNAMNREDVFDLYHKQQMNTGDRMRMSTMRDSPKVVV